MFFYGNDFVVAIGIVVVAVVVYFECVDFVVFAAGAVHILSVDCVVTVVEIIVIVFVAVVVVIVVVVVDDDGDVAVVIDLRQFVISSC